ncbi:MAG: LmbZ [Candidatus Firestonebacteria bacterium RIFOXYA2_FULL_40_8]|nr:MAG: LmbZ [Candidatus Firestonebacteria bacterium RIFOXYA2_FULL_40_8]
MNIGIIGCGLIGKKRALNISSEDKIFAVCDINSVSAKELGSLYNCKSLNNWKELIADKSVDIVVVSTTHNLLAEISLAAIKNGKHVLVEKPAARNADELQKVLKIYNKTKKIIVKVGFNHRFHPAMQKAKAMISSGDIGKLMFIRGRYGHGGRVGYDKEWRAVPQISGGGELLDQGMHLIDLSRWYMGDFSKSTGITKTYFWNMKVEDNAFMLLTTKNRQVAQLHVSWTEWKNTFSLEIYGKTGKIAIDGLGKSYGTEKLTYYKMSEKMGPPDTKVFEFPGEDNSWKEEWLDFKKAIKTGKEPCGNLEDACKALQIVKAIYKENRNDYR